MIYHIATKCARNISNSGMHDVSMSDYYMVFCVRKIHDALQKDSKIIKTRSMKHLDENAFPANVSNIWWEGTLSETDDANVLVKNGLHYFH